MNISEKEVTEATVHNILNYYLTMATREPQNYKSVVFTIQIPYEELAKTSGVTKAKASLYEGSALQIETKLSWVEHDTTEVEVLISREEQDND